MRTKLVTMMRIEGATDRTVMSPINWIDAFVDAGALAKLIEMFQGAEGPVSSATARAARGQCRAADAAADPRGSVDE